MLIPRKTVIAGIVFGLFVSGASLAQAAELNKDTVVTPKGEAGQLVDPPRTKIKMLQATAIT